MDEELRQKIRQWKRSQESVNAAIAEERGRRTPGERLERALALVAQHDVLGPPRRSPNDLTPERRRWARLQERLRGRH